MKLPRGCIYCRHKLECHKDTNEGKGLRVFQYAKGLAYLTKVMKEPKVKEITNEFKKKGYHKFDCFVAIGGGSTIDFAKGVATLLKNSGSGLQYRGFPKNLNPSI